MIAKRFQQHYSALFVSLPGDEEKFGGCLAAGRGFIHINPEGKVEACLFFSFLRFYSYESHLSRSIEISSYEKNP